MQFADYLRAVTAARGNEFAGTPGAVDELRQMGAFAGMPALANVYRQAVASHAARNFIALGAWDDDARRLVDRFVAHTGFIPDLAEYVFRALGYATGMAVPAPEQTGAERSGCREVSRASDSASTTDSAAACNSADASDCVAESAEAYHAMAPADAAVPAVNPAWRCHADAERKRAYAEALVEVDREREPILGVAVSDPHCTGVGEHSVTLTFEFRRTAPHATAMLNYALYDVRGRVMETGMAAALTVESAGRTPHTLRLVCRPERLSKILLYLD